MIAIAILTFAGALIAAVATICLTVAPSMSKIRAALSGAGTASLIPPLPQRHGPTYRVTSLRPVMLPAMTLRAAA